MRVWCGLLSLCLKMSARDAVALSYAPPLTGRSEREIIGCAIRVRVLTHHYEEFHDQLQPQGGASFCTRKPNRRRDDRTARTGERRIHQVSERRGCARRAPAFHQGVACCLGEAYSTSRLYGTATTVCTEIKVGWTRL